MYSLVLYVYIYHTVPAEQRQVKALSMDSSNLPRSLSAQSLKQLQDPGQDDKLTLLAQLFWIAVSLLESDYEHEFLLAVNLLDKVILPIKVDHRMT